MAFEKKLRDRVKKLLKQSFTMHQNIIHHIFIYFYINIINLNDIKQNFIRVNLINCSAKHFGTL